MSKTKVLFETLPEGDERVLLMLLEAAKAVDGIHTPKDHYWHWMMSNYDDGLSGWLELSYMAPASMLQRGAEFPYYGNVGTQTLLQKEVMGIKVRATGDGPKVFVHNAEFKRSDLREGFVGYVLEHFAKHLT
ncbi:hypothetical protein A2881_05935 [Candidatus Peribacteria bacterium RIFCSPHIGHO2_01_FULL_55_13]|nr:MAG: hypothetical protein A2881_05935 [Candidatus Peribacteria bacterium RIFCSPHIGHO2_01_FULL_55_13]